MEEYRRLRKWKVIHNTITVMVALVTFIFMYYCFTKYLARPSTDEELYHMKQVACEAYEQVKNDTIITEGSGIIDGIQITKRGTTIQAEGAGKMGMGIVTIWLQDGELVFDYDSGKTRSILCGILEGLVLALAMAFIYRSIFTYLINKHIEKTTNSLQTENAFKLSRREITDRPMCMAGEIGKIVVNKCLERNIFINTQKLEKLLVLMQIEHMKRVKKALFSQDILVRDCGVVIEEVDSAFMQYAVEFNEKQIEYILLLDEQLKTVEHVLKKYGDMDALKINELLEIQTLISKSVLIEGRRVISSNIMLGFYYF